MIDARGHGGAVEVVVTGLGLVTALGAGVETVWDRLLAGADGTGDLTRFPAAAYRVRRACEIPDGRSTARDAGSLMLDIAMRAASEAAWHAGVVPVADPARTGLIFGTLGSADVAGYEATVRAGGSGELDQRAAAALMPSTVATAVAGAVGCEGRVSTVLTACASGNHAAALARRWIQTGRADVMLVCAADVISQTQYTHFHNLRTLAPDVCRPFDRRRRGLVLGEGAACLVLESEPHARRRGVSILARVLGAGLSADAFHMTAPAPDGIGARRAIESALADAGVSLETVDYVSAHGTGTVHNDRVESRLLCEMFGRHVPASSVKSMVGHCMGAASAIEAVVCVLALRDQVVPPTIHCEEPDPDCPIDCVAEGARELRARVVLNLAFAFGGNNGVLVLGAYA